MAQKTQTGALYQPRSVEWGERREGDSKGGDICIPMGDKNCTKKIFMTQIIMMV